MSARALPEIRFDVDRRKIALYAVLTADANPIHLDEAFAANTAMGGIIGHGSMTSNLLWQVLARAGLVATTMAVRFLAPVRPGDRLVAGGSVDATGTCRLWVRNQDGVEVLGGEAVTAARVVPASASV